MMDREGSLLLHLFSFTKVSIRLPFRRGFWDPLLNLGPSPGVQGREKASSRRIRRVVFACRDPRGRRRLIRWLESRGVKVEELLGGYFGALVPSQVLAEWRGRWARSSRSSRFLVFSGERPVVCPPVETYKTTSDYTPAAELGRRVRTFRGSELPAGRGSGEGKVVAILDTGIKAVTPALREALVEGVSFAPDESGPEDQNGHGTAVAQLVLAVAPKVKLIGVKVLDDEGRGTLYSILRGIRYVAENRDRIDVVNLSLGAEVCHGADTCPLCVSVKTLADLGIPVAASIGNSGPAPGTISCPGSSSGALGVAAVDVEGRVTPWSSRGPSVDPTNPKPNLASYGDKVGVKDLEGRLWVASGTSFSSPLVAGVLAAILGEGKKVGQARALYRVVQDHCTQAAVGSRDQAVGKGLVNLKTTLEALGVKGAWGKARRRKSGLLKPLLAAAVLLWGLGSLWGWGLGHLGWGPPGDGEEAWFLGRVRQGGPLGRRLGFDDGTGRAELFWEGPETGRPRPGMVVLLRARRTGEGILLGERRWDLWPF